MKQPYLTVVLTGGGTGGHITPLLSLAQELKRLSPGCQLIYIGNKGDSVDTFKQSGHDFDFTAFISAGKFRRYGTLRFGGLLHPNIFIKNLADFFKLPGSVIKSIRILRKVRPSVVFSKGGFVALPVAFAAKLLDIPIVTHDSDAAPGLANRIISRWAASIATGMPEKYYDYPQNRVHYVGIPINPQITKITPAAQGGYKDQIGIPRTSKLLLVAGGSSGSVQLNDLIGSVAEELLETHLDLWIIHLTGQAHLANAQSNYSDYPASLKKRLKIQPASDEFYRLAGAADLVITRAGATTIAELAAAAKACIIVPAAQLAGGHQLMNAQALADKDAAVIAAPDIQPDELMALINSLLNDDKRRYDLARNLHATHKPAASKELAELILRTTAG